MKMFRELDEKETALFQKWARDNYKPGEPISGIWHPIAQAECVKMNIEREQELLHGLYRPKGGIS